MKRALATILTAAMFGAAVAEPLSNPFEKPPPLPAGYTMTSQQATLLARPYLPRIARCYQSHANAAYRDRGDLSLYLVVARTGRVVYAEVTAPGGQLEDDSPLGHCVRHEVDTWRFPAHPGFSNVTIFYFDLGTDRPASGTRPRALPNV